tara:strand:- start:10435 stop:11562 length:1128 start_codon:yes stop_codon:yes gene_type:complete
MLLPPGSTIAVVGIGKLGLCFAVTLASLGLKVIAVDTNTAYIDRLVSGNFSSPEPGLDSMLHQFRDAITFSAEPADAAQACVVFFLVQTPVIDNNLYDHAYLNAAIDSVASACEGPTRMVVNSTVIPGFMREVAARHPAHAFFYNPAFVAQGDVLDGYRSGGWFGVVLIGSPSKDDGEFLVSIYEELDPNTRVIVVSPESAELCKLSSNCFRTMKIAFANMVADIARATPGASANEVCTMLSQDKSIGAHCMRPGYGYGGPCYPRDNRALSAFAHLAGVPTSMLDAIDTENNAHHDRMASALAAENREVYEFADVGYKPGLKVPMIDASPPLAVAERLANLGKSVAICAPPEFERLVRIRYGDAFTYNSVQKKLL